MSDKLPADAIFNAAFEIAQKDAKTREELREAFKRGDMEEILRLAKELCRITDDEIRIAQQKKGKR